MARKVIDRAGTGGGLVDGEELLKASEVADLLRGGLRSVWRQAAAGLLHPIKVPYVGTRFRRSEVTTLIQRAAQDGGAR